MKTHPIMLVPARLAAVACIMLLTPAGCDRQEPRADAVSGPTLSTGTYPASSAASAPASRPAAAPRRALFGPDSRPARLVRAPAEEASSQPVLPPAAEPTPFLPLADAVKGEQARYAAMQSRTIDYEIIEVAATTVKTQIVIHDHGKPLGLPAIREDRRDLDPVAGQAQAAGADRRASRATIQAVGRQWQATLYEDRWIDEEIHYVRQTWVSPQVPVFGTIRMEQYGDDVLEARLELVAFKPEQ